MLYLIGFFLMNILMAFSSPIQLDANNLQSVINSNNLVFINFYADWCHFSQMLTPIYDQLSVKVEQELQPGNKLAIARVDCDKEVNIAQQYKVSKYPTLKLVRDGVAMKREYRGQRSVDAFFEFLKDQMKDVIIYHNSGDSLKFENAKSSIVGHFLTKETTEFTTFRNVASTMRDQCDFHAFIGENTNGQSLEYIEAVSDNKSGNKYVGDLSSKTDVSSWALSQCVSLVREITFTNAEELTEEGLPFLILFMDPNDKESLTKYTQAVKDQLLHERNTINFLWGNGNTFTHPLQHLGKSTNDLPLLTIDSFRHMYLFPHNFKEAISKGHLLRDFVADLHSGKLHREFHYGPDSTTAAPQPEVKNSNEVSDKPAEEKLSHVPRESTDTEGKIKRPTTPPESIFKKLQPSKNRYTILKDEL